MQATTTTFELIPIPKRMMIGAASATIGVA